MCERGGQRRIFSELKGDVWHRPNGTFAEPGADGSYILSDGNVLLSAQPPGDPEGLDFTLCRWQGLVSRNPIRGGGGLFKPLHGRPRADNSANHPQNWKLKAVNWLRGAQPWYWVGRLGGGAFFFSSHQSKLKKSESKISHS